MIEHMKMTCLKESGVKIKKGGLSLLKKSEPQHEERTTIKITMIILNCTLNLFVML